MSFGLGAAGLIGVAVGGAGILSGIMSSNAAEDAAAAQTQATNSGISEQRMQFNKVMELLAPYVSAGTTAVSNLQPYAAAGPTALMGQQALLGQRGAAEQQQAINQLAQSPEMQAMIQQGENALLQNASATGGLRGGNIQAALAQFRPEMLSNLINQQYARLGGMTALGADTTANIARLGQASAAGTGAAAQQSAGNIASLLAYQGNAQAQAELQKGKSWEALPNSIMSGLTQFQDFGGTF